MAKRILRVRTALLYGLVLWLIPFLVYSLGYALKKHNPALAGSIRHVVMTLCVVILLVLYSRKAKPIPFRETLLIAILWFVMCIALDLVMFIWGPAEMTLGRYVTDIGLTYLTIPTIAIGLGYLAAAK